MSNDVNELLALKEKIEDAKSRQAKLEGNLEELMKQLKKDFDCSTIKQAEKKLETLSTKIEKVQTEFDKKKEAFEEKYDL